MPSRSTLYLLANAAFLLTVVVGAVVNDSEVSFLYLVALFALCSAPILWLESLNGRFVLLGVFMAFYFLFFGMIDFLAVLSGGPTADVVEDPGAAELAILVGAACALVGYHITSSAKRSKPAAPSVDWPVSFILGVGLTLWLIGSASVIYFQVYVMPEKTIAAAQRGLTNLGPLMTFVVMLGNLVAPLGLLILAYGYAKFRTVFWLSVILGVLAAQVALAFVTDTRGQAFLPPAVVIVALTLKDGKLPKVWLAAALVAMPILFPILTAYRVEITGGRGMTREQAVNNLGKVVDIVLGSTQRDHAEANKASIFARASIKGNFEIEYAHAGIDRPFQQGNTLMAIPLAFIPRIIWPSKPDVQTGQLFNHEFFPGGVADTYISPSHFGELYWNFGWPGLVFGMVAIGMLLGFIGAKTNLKERFSVTGVLVSLATVQYLCWGFEGATAVSYVLWLRSLAAIGILHLLFARRAISVDEPVGAMIPSPPPALNPAGAAPSAMAEPSAVTSVPRYSTFLR